MGQSNWLIVAQNKNKIGLLKHPQLIIARPELGEVTRAPGQNLISPACPSPVPNPPVLAHPKIFIQNPLPPSCLQRWARENTKPPSQALSQTNWQTKWINI